MLSCQDMALFPHGTKRMGYLTMKLSPSLGKGMWRWQGFQYLWKG